MLLLRRFRQAHRECRSFRNPWVVGFETQIPNFHIRQLNRSFVSTGNVRSILNTTKNTMSTAIETPSSPQSVDEKVSPTNRLYYNDTYLFESKSVVVGVEELPSLDKKKPDEKVKAVVLEDTIFHPQGGGQPSDVGTIDSTDGKVSFNVTAVRANMETGVIYHYGEFLSESGILKSGDEVMLLVKSDERLKNARLHSAGHLIDQAMANIGYNLEPTKGYHFEDGPFVEYKGKLADPKEKETLPARLNEAIVKLIDDQIDTVMKMVNVEEAQAVLGGECDLSHLPQDKPVRLVSVAGMNCPCGGTHVKNSEELKNLSVHKVKAKGGKLKVYYKFVSE